MQAGASPLRSGPGDPGQVDLAPQPQPLCLWTEDEHATSLGMACELARGAPGHGPRIHASAGTRMTGLTAC